MTDVVFNSLLDQASLNYLSNKKLVQGFSHYDVWLKEHQIAFTVAKMMDDDMLAEVKTALESAIKNGTDFNTFKKQLVPYLMSRGWWGEQVMGDPLTGEIKKVQLGSFRRLKTIFETNLSTAYAAGKWARISDSSDEFPYLKYIPSVSDKKRDTHKKYYNQIWRVNDPIWQSIFPPNGYGCKCSVRQLNEKQALRERHEDIKNQPESFTDEQKANAKAGIIDDKNIVKWVDFTNPRTGEIVRVPDNITPSFAHNHGDRLAALQNVYAQKHGKTAETVLKRASSDYVVAKVVRPLFDELQLKPNLTVQNQDIPNAQQIVHELAGTGSQYGSVPVGQNGSIEWFKKGRQYYLLQYHTDGVVLNQISKKDLLHLRKNEILDLIWQYASQSDWDYLKENEADIAATNFKNADMADKLAAFLYTTNGGYKEVNPKLIAAKGDLKAISNDKTRQIIRLIDDFLANAPKFKGTTTRKLYKANMPKLDEFLNAHSSGNMVRYSNFTSTSKEGNQFGSSRADIFLTIKGYSGVDITDLSRYQDIGKKEVLMPRHAVYRVINKVEQDGVIHIELEELQEKQYNEEKIIQLSLMKELI